ncbi:MAG: hypothetical protein WC714_28700 [Candidatus Obscuribacterales bacterium]|jgi:hypothetical protein
MINPLVFAALVALISASLKAYAPQFPISDELITIALVGLFSWFGLEVGQAALAKFAPKQDAFLRERNLLK